MSPRLLYGSDWPAIQDHKEPLLLSVLFRPEFPRIDRKPGHDNPRFHKILLFLYIFHNHPEEQIPVHQAHKKSYEK